MASECAVCYVADMNFMLPSLISAAGVRRFVPADKADIFIFAIDNDDARIHEINKLALPHGVQVVHMNNRHFADIDWARANKTHVPLPALGRFFMADLLPEACRKIVYLDGDTWVKQSPSFLIDMPIPEEMFAAAEDASFFCKKDLTAYGRSVRSYFRKLGINDKIGYFNSGVFVVKRNTWRRIAAEAADFFKHNIDICKYHDQSALNAIVGDRRKRLSLAWNFQTLYRYWNIEGEVDPAIYHFTQGYKPWNGAIAPWTEFSCLYDRERLVFSSLNLPITRLTHAQIYDANLHSRYQANKLHYLFPLRLWSRRNIVRLTEAQVGQPLNSDAKCNIPAL